MKTKVSPSKGLISEQYRSREFIYPNSPSEAEDKHQKEMAHDFFQEETSAFRFPIRGSNEETKMKNIPHSSLPNFHGLSKEDPNTFLFKFNVLCRSHDYMLDAQKLNVFPTTLNIIELQWFMGLGRDNICTRDQIM
jgi:hypothetical protein